MEAKKSPIPREGRALKANFKYLHAQHSAVASQSQTALASRIVPLALWEARE
jgi:hypothetical protein